MPSLDFRCFRFCRTLFQIAKESVGVTIYEYKAEIFLRPEITMDARAHDIQLICQIYG